MLERILLILLLVYTTQVVGQNVIPEFQAYGDGKKSDGEYCCQIFVKNELHFSSIGITTMFKSSLPCSKELPNSRSINPYSTGNFGQILRK